MLDAAAVRSGSGVKESNEPGVMQMATRVTRRTVKQSSAHTKRKDTRQAIAVTIDSFEKQQKK